MEKSQLDFNAPLLSARRFISPRNSTSEAQLLNKSLAASVPFNWEQAPGRPKNTRDTSDDHTLLQNLNDSLSSIDESDSSQTQSEEVSTVRNSLSLTEAWSGSKLKPSGKSCVDKQTREFMMSRFLTAAKAANLETQKKKLAINEKQKEIRKVVSMKIITEPLIMKDNESDGLQLPYLDNEDDQELGSVKKSGRCSWGIDNIPGICVNLKNPLMSIKLKSQPPTPSNGEEIGFQRNVDSSPQVHPRKKFYSRLLSLDSHTLKCNNSNKLYHQLLSSPNRSGLSPMRKDIYWTNQVKEKRQSDLMEGRKAGSKYAADDVRMYLNHDHDKEYRDVRSHEEGVKRGIKGGDNNRIGEWDDLPLKTPLPPPLPKSPLESWLWSTFPSIPHSSRNSPIQYGKASCSKLQIPQESYMHTS